MAHKSTLFPKRQTGVEMKLQLSPMIDCVFQLLIFFIVTLNMDPSLDDIMRLPDAYKSTRQEELNMEIYLLPAGMIAGKDGQVYVVDNWLAEDGHLSHAEGVDYSGQIAFAAKGNYDSMFVHLDDVPFLIDREREKKWPDLKRYLNNQRQRRGQVPLNKAQEDSAKASMALLMKVHKNVFYGRVLQVVEKAKEAGVFTFAFVTDVKTSQLMDKDKQVVQ